MSEQLIHECNACKNKNTNLLRCSKCKQKYYCNQQCQKKDWSQHKLQCKSDILKQVKNPQIPEKKQTKEDPLCEFGKLQHIGTGNFSMIYKTKNKKDNKYYAIKQVQKAKVSRLRKQADVFMEKHCLGKLKDCEYVVTLNKTFQDQFSLYFQMQYPENGELWELSKTFGIIPNAWYKYFASHIIKAISILHNQYQIVHRDLKPENILLNANNQIKLIDFGTAKDLSRPDLKGSGNGAKGKKVFEHYVGTPNYMAPQCIHNKSSEKVSDIYSLSGTLYFLKVGSPPFAGGSQYLVYTKSLENKLNLPSLLFDTELSNLLSQMNQKDAEKRININQIMHHEYFHDIDFNNLPSFETIKGQITQFEEILVQCCNYISSKFGQKYKQSIESRKEAYSSIKEYLRTIQQKASQSKKIEKENIIQRLEIIDIQTQIFLNIRDDNNVSFAQIAQQYKLK